MSSHTLDLLALTLVPGLGDQNIKQLISYCGSPNNVFTTKKGKLMSIPGFGEKTAEIITKNKTHQQAEEILLTSEKKGMTVLSYLDEQFPRRLRSVMDSPNILFTKGQGSMNARRTVAIVGTRRATNYGKEITEKIVEEAASLNVQVISGLAYGIDITAHRAALKNNLSTIGVLAGGLDKVYPSVHRKYAEEMQQNGAILTESIPGTTPDAHLFPARNRIIAGMADAVIIVEAAEKGGALITAKIADSYNRALFAVPGNVGNQFSVGTNRLIASQLAVIYTGVKDLQYHLNWDSEATDSDREVETPDLTEEEKKIFDLLSSNGQPVEIDQLAIKSQIPINQVASVLLGLEFKNLVKSLPGKKYSA